MTLELFIRYLHFISMLAVAGTLVTQHMLIETNMVRSKLRKLARIDTVYGIFAVLVLITGLTMWLWVGKGSDFYTKNPLFHIKLTLFLVIAIISIFPSIYFIKNRKGNQEDVVHIPKKIVWYLRIEILILFLLPLLAVLIARGISF